jgi:hypothetical protein
VTTNTVDPAQPTASTVVVAADGSVTVTQVSNATTVTYPGVFSTPFSPLDLSPALWVDASDETTITESGGAVSQWDNKGSLGNFTQGTAASQPTTGATTLNGKNVIDFAADHLLSTDSAATFTFLLDGSQYAAFAVVKAGTAPNINAAYSWLSTEIVPPYSYFEWFYDDRSFVSRNDQVTHEIGITGTIIVQNRLNDTMTANAFHVVSLVADPANATAAARSIQSVDGGTDIAENTATAAPSSTAPNRTLAIGYAAGGLAFTGSIAEMILVDGTLTAQQIADTEAYLANKWGITL